MGVLLVRSLWFGICLRALVFRKFLYEVQSILGILTIIFVSRMDIGFHIGVILWLTESSRYTPHIHEDSGKSIPAVTAVYGNTSQPMEISSPKVHAGRNLA